jgi:hypothetical protein
VTIVCTDGKVMAADSLQLRGDHLVVNRNRRKLFRMPDGSVVGMAGEASLIEATKRWMLAGEDYDHPPRAPADILMKGLRLYPDGRVEMFDQLFAPFATEVPAAVGAADEMAMALLGAGIKPAQTVRECIKWCVYVGGPVRTMKPKGKQ